MKRYALLIVFCVLSASGGFAQTKSPVEGAWRIAEWVERGETITNPQPGLIIFTRGYYSVAIVMKPRAALGPTKDPQNLTDAEKIDRFEQWRPFTAISGTYEVKGSMLVMRPIVAKNVWDMTRQTPQEPTFKLEGPTTLWLIPTGDKAEDVGLRMKLTRLE